MNESVKFNKSANICFIVAGILFLLHPLLTLIFRAERQIVGNIIITLFSSHSSYSSSIFYLGDFVGYGAAGQISNILLFVGLMILCLILAIGCFAGKKTNIVLAIGSIITLLYQIINVIVSFIREISFIIKSIIQHYFRFSELFFIVLNFIPYIVFIVALILFTIVCFTGFKKRVPAIIGSVAMVFYVLSNAFYVIVSLITGLVDHSGIATNLIVLNRLISYFIFDLLAVLPFILILLFVKQVKTVE